MSETRETEELLNRIISPVDLRRLPVESLPSLCAELRRFIIRELSVNPGHFAASLGAVELTVALHYVYNTPYDRLVWDVGHQAYTHKILTERRERFSTNRKMGGLSGFPSPAESEYDTFPAGHASNSISAALGMAVAANVKGECDRKVVAIIGDAAIAGGMAFEAINNASAHPNDLLIVLNDNDMAIDRNVGSLRQYLLEISTSPRYNRARNALYRFLRRMGVVSDEHRGRITRFTNSLKSFISHRQNIFEGLNVRYFGPADGHDVIGLVRIFRDIHTISGPKILHLHTVKGKGYTPAEEAATEWHAPGKFDVESGKRLIPDSQGQPPLYQEVFGDTITRLAEQNDKIVVVTPAMSTGSALLKVMAKFPTRTFDVGIAEEHAVTFSAGLAREGLVPYCVIYSTFLQRGFDQIVHDISIAHYPVVLCIDRAGLVGEDGATHHGTLDIAYLRCIPGMIICSPYDEQYLQHLLYTAQTAGAPFALRYPRGRGSLLHWQCTPQRLPIGKGRCLRQGEGVALLSIGPIGKAATRAIDMLAMTGISVAHYDMIFAKPIDEELLHTVAKTFRRVITLEDGTINGGMGSAVIEFMNDHNYPVSVRRLGVPDAFIGHGTLTQLHALCGIDDKSILKEITLLLKD